MNNKREGSLFKMKPILTMNLLITSSMMQSKRRKDPIPQELCCMEEMIFLKMLTSKD